jgi:GR25 family glycosyltransferase involved in LPS biosynthesis
VKAVSIVIKDNKISELGYSRLVESSKAVGNTFDIQRWNAITPETMFDVTWQWPMRKKQTCNKTGLVLSAYKNIDINKRISCAQSHYVLWKKCVELNEPICILEHDAIFIKTFDLEDFAGGAMSINSPTNATFNDKIYDSLLENKENEVPWVTDKTVPQGLPGNSAYIIKPCAAKKAIELQDSIGWWPNDAILCKQLCPWLTVYKPYFTTLQNIKSTTVN